MPKRERVLDTNELIAHWHQSRRGRIADHTAADAARWAEGLIEFRGTDAIVTPVAIEFLAGVQGAHELDLSRAYLGRFRIIDDRRVLPEDWDEVERLAARVPRDGLPRQLVDCLIRALARRLKFDIITRENRFPH